jgi:hypothetical protein
VSIVVVASLRRKLNQLPVLQVRVAKDEKICLTRNYLPPKVFRFAVLIMDKKVEAKTPELMHGFKSNKASKASSKLVVILLVAALVGIGTGYMLSSKATNSSTTSGKGLMGSHVEKGKVYGEESVSDFEEQAPDGELKEGGIDGEGQYHLVRPGGDSKSVYITSSNVDLSQFINHKVKVWGHTQKAQTAGWLMDVGRVQVLE